MPKCDFSSGYTLCKENRRIMFVTLYFYCMNEWHDLFVATVSSAAALAGLIFVGVSINLAKILAIITLPERALVALILLLTILLLSICFLIPVQTNFAAGIENLIIAFFVWLFTIKMDVSIYRNIEVKFKRYYRFNMAINQLCIIPYLISAILLLNGSTNALFYVVAGFILSFIKSIMDSWVLLVEINR